VDEDEEAAGLERGFEEGLDCYLRLRQLE